VQVIVALAGREIERACAIALQRGESRRRFGQVMSARFLFPGHPGDEEAFDQRRRFALPTIGGATLRAVGQGTSVRRFAAFLRGKEGGDLRAPGGFDGHPRGCRAQRGLSLKRAGQPRL